MKKALSLALPFMALWLLIPSLVFAGSATIRWQANTESDFKEYRVYYGTASRTYGTPIPVGKLTSYTINNLSEGVTYYFAVTAVDTADNESGFSQEVSKTIVDSGLPTIAVSSPTNQSTYETSRANLDLSGTAADNVGVTAVSWSNSRGGSGTASGTNTWSISAVPLSSGTNVITIKAVDRAGNQKSTSLTITYTPPDTSAPRLAVTSPTNQSTYETSRANLDLSGTAADNVGVTAVGWSNSRGGSGTASGTNTWSISGIRLSIGTNVISVTAVDQAGNLGKFIMTVSYTPPDTTAPAVPVGVNVE